MKLQNPTLFKVPREKENPKFQSQFQPLG